MREDCEVRPSTPEARLAPPQHGIAARATTDEFARAAGACNFAVVVWALPQGVVALANEEASKLFAIPLPLLVGTKNVDLLGPCEAVEDAFASLSSRAVEYVRARRSLPRGDELTSVWVWSRAVEIDDALGVLSVIVPTADLGRLGRDPSAPWRDLAPVAVGTIGPDWTIDTVSIDLLDIIGATAGDVIGSSLLDLAHPDDAGFLLGPSDGQANGPRSHCLVRLRHRDGSWIEVCVLVAPETQERSASVAFALLGVPRIPSPATADRVAELELRLRHIATEVRAAGVLDEVEALPSIGDHPQLSGLTSRQWEVLSRLLRGDRVQTIALALFVSPSTVRNHLSSIYERFGVHSQAELLEVLRRPPSADDGLLVTSGRGTFPQDGPASTPTLDGRKSGAR
jgi:DNA-binding CsgD family transcriptional regulator/PAS domain-containing protein